MKITLSILFVLLQINAFTCSCKGTESVEQAIKNADVVVNGSILSKEFITLIDSTAIFINEKDSSIIKGPGYAVGIVRYKMEIITTFKGKLISDTIDIYTGNGGGDCGVRFELGKKYIVYGKKETYFGTLNNNISFPKGKNIAWTNICSRTVWENKEELELIKKHLNKPKK